jgi:hypothetical protein
LLNYGLWIAYIRKLFTLWCSSTENYFSCSAKQYCILVAWSLVPDKQHSLQVFENKGKGKGKGKGKVVPVLFF